MTMFVFSHLPGALLNTLFMSGSCFDMQYRMNNRSSSQKYSIVYLANEKQFNNNTKKKTEKKK